MLNNILSIFIGGGIGAVTRYTIGVIFSNYLKLNFPIATFSVNIIGSFILGFLYIYLINKTQIPTNLKLALTVGFCGGLTTFSTFSLEIYEMIQNSQIINAFIYLSISLIVGLLSVFLGGYICKTFII